VDLDSAEKRLDRFEGKIDKISDQLAAFPVVGQRLQALEATVKATDTRLNALEKQQQENTATLKNGERMLWAGGAAALAFGKDVLAWAKHLLPPG
jgi:septal ring factor EnvC (AmiA/AmiB activator)